MAGWKTEKIYYSRKFYFRDVIEQIRLAKRSIEIETYIFKCDAIGSLVAFELLAASQRGVHVRVLVDGFGAFSEISQLISFFSESSVQFVVYHPLRLSHSVNKKWIQIHYFFHFFSNINRRLHRKMSLIDRHVLFVGSFNITDNSNRETGVRLTGGLVQQVLLAFEETWAVANSSGLLPRMKKPSYWSSSFIKLNSNRKRRRISNQNLIRRIHSGVSRIWMTNAYFVPAPQVLRALIASRLKVLDVEILLPFRSDVPFLKFITETYYRGMLLAGLRVFEYQNEFLHAKTLLVDDWALVGTSNMNHRSVFHDLEVDVVLTKKTSVESLSEQFLVDRSHSIEITLENLAPRKWLDPILSWVITKLRYWL